MALNVVNKENKDDLKAIYDDVIKWAYCFIRIRDRQTGELIPWVARNYQASAMRDDSTRKVLRWGRRCGKTETQVVRILHKCLKRPGFRVVIVTPFESQVRLIFMRLNEIIEDSPYIKMDVKSTTKNPYQMTFNNGSAILGFTAGTRSGSGGSSIRGQKADLIYIDEADYLQDNEIEAVVAIALERPDIEIVLTSTPTGKRAFFYRACTNPDMGYKEFYTPSTAMPTWNKKMEAEFKAMFSEVAYDHEVYANFGEEVTGVFNKTKIDQATEVQPFYYMPLNSQQLDYIDEKKINPIVIGPYSINKPAPAAYRCAGIDWDKYAAVSTIIITEFDTQFMRFKPVFRSDIPKSEFSLDAAVKKIIELNEIFKPQFIYCDRGFGEDVAVHTQHYRRAWIISGQNRWRLDC